MIIPPFRLNVKLTLLITPKPGINDYVVHYEIIVMSTNLAIVAFMKKEVIIITPETKDIIQAHADKDERTLAWMVRKLILEALDTRGLLKKQKPGK